jgi:hypothetical protein
MNKKELIINDVFFPHFSDSDYLLFLKDNASDDEINDFLFYQRIYKQLNDYKIFDNENITISKFKGCEPGSIVFTLNYNELIKELNGSAICEIVKMIFSNPSKEYKCKYCGAYTFAYRYYVNDIRAKKCVDCSLFDTQKELSIIRKYRLKFGVCNTAKLQFNLLNI